MNIDITKLDETELVELNRRIVARLKYLQEARTHHQMLSYSVGDRVRFHPPGHDPKTGVIVKYNRDGRHRRSPPVERRAGVPQPGGRLGHARGRRRRGKGHPAVNEAVIAVLVKAGSRAAYS
ncbi:hypothetical protein BURK2_02648 [Burkholderiales bacterium]|nr:hypothetical protein BURK2_02648 [Burkholderiales bacterium]